MEKERWKEIYGGRYEVSSFGRVRRVFPARGTKPGKVLKQYLKWTSKGQDGKSYQYASITVSVGDGWTRQIAVHRLVAEVFIGSCPKGYCVNHKDDDKLNNAVSNLEYVTVRENALHASRLGLLVRGEDHQHAKVTEVDVIAIREAVRDGVTYSKLSKRYGLNRSTLHAIIYHKTWKHVGGPLPPDKRLLKNRAKLNEGQVRKIRELYASGITMQRLADMFDVTLGTIQPLIRRKTWKHVT